MISRSGRVAFVFNGEIYNHIDLQESWTQEAEHRAGKDIGFSVSIEHWLRGPLRE